MSKRLATRGKATLDKPAVRRGQVNGIKRVPAISGVRKDRRGPAQPGQVLTNSVGHSAGGGLLSIGRADPCNANRINVNQQPAPVSNVRVARQVARLRYLDAVRAAGQDFGPKGVQGEVDAAGGVGQT